MFLVIRFSQISRFKKSFCKKVSSYQAFEAFSKIIEMVHKKEEKMLIWTEWKMATCDRVQLLAPRRRRSAERKSCARSSVSQTTRTFRVRLWTSGTSSSKGWFSASLSVHFIISIPFQSFAIKIESSSIQAKFEKFEWYSNLLRFSE